MSRQVLTDAVVAAMSDADGRPMRWGKDDCALWVANALRPALGYDPAAKVRRRYKTRRGADRVAGPSGLLGQIRRIARRHEWQRIAPTLAQPGDVGMAWVARDGAPVLATVMCRARGWFVGRAEMGFTAIPANQVAFAWSVLPDALANEPGPRVSLSRMQMGSNLRPSAQMSQEPVSTFIGLTALISSFGVSAAVAGAIGGFVVTAAISIGVSLVTSLIQPHTGSTLADPTVSNTVSASSAQITERQALPYKRVIVGTAYVGGALFFEQVENGYLTMGVLVNYGEISGVDKIFIGTNQLQFSSIVDEAILTPLPVDGQPDYPSNLLVSLRYGSEDQATDRIILNRYPDIDLNFRQRGIATAVYRFAYGVDQEAFTALWGQVQRPTTYTVVRGVVCYDPRDPTQNPDDESTWKFTNNATLVQTWYLTRPFGGRIPMSRIRWNKIRESADYDYSLIGCLDGTLIPRHTIDGVIMLNQQPFQVMQDLLTANRGMVIESGGQVWIQSSIPRTAVATIHDRILAGGVTYQGGKQKSDLVNKLQVRFVAPSQDYQVVDGPVLSRTDLQAADGEVLPATLGLNYTQDHRRAQRLQKCFLENSRLGRTITCNVDIRLMAVASDELVGSVVTFDSVLFAKMNGTYLITAVGFADDCTTLALAMTEYDATIESNWNPEYDERSFVLADVLA